MKVTERKRQRLLPEGFAIFVYSAIPVLILKKAVSNILHVFSNSQNFVNLKGKQSCKLPQRLQFDFIHCENITADENNTFTELSIFYHFDLISAALTIIYINIAQSID